MSTHVILLRDKNDPDHQDKVAVMRACMKAGVEMPEEIGEYFDHTNDEDIPLEIEFKARKWSDESRMGFEIDIDEIPKGVKTIRFYNAW